MAEIAGRNFPSTNRFPGSKLLRCKTLIGGKHAMPFQLPVRVERSRNSRTLTLLQIHGVKQIRSELGKRSTYSSRINTDIPLYEIDGASFDQYLEDKPRVFEAIFPDKRRSQKLNEEEWRISMLPIQFFFATVWPVVDMRLVCRTKGQDYPPGVPRDISKVLELDIIRWELQGLNDLVKPGEFSLGVKGALYPDRRGPRSRLKGQLEMKIDVVLPQMFSLLPEDVVRNVSESVLTRLVENMKEKVNGSLLLDYSKFRREKRQKNLV
ncbi:hypothetical protein V2J09_012464 [Rumex salicifolius]